jgi:polyadenylation factor subunit 2
MSNAFSPKVSNNAPGIQSAEDAEQEAAERNLIRRCIDYHNPAVIDIQNRLFHTACRGHHMRRNTNNSPYALQPHANYIRLMGMPIGKSSSAPIPSELFLTYRAHVTRAKNSTPIICLSWTPGGRRLLTGNHEGEFTLWDGCTYDVPARLSLGELSNCLLREILTSLLLLIVFVYSQRLLRLN